jgi:hypothetical protein
MMNQPGKTDSTRQRQPQHMHSEPNGHGRPAWLNPGHTADSCLFGLLPQRLGRVTVRRPEGI